MHTDERDYSMMFHPYNVMMTLLLIGLSVFFITLPLAYVYTRTQNGLPPIKIPTLFLVNTLILIASSYTMVLAKKSYINDDTAAYKKNLNLTLLLTIAFAIAQGIAWMMMMQNNVSISSSNAAAYVYAISILHLLHVLGGIPFLFAFAWVAHKRMKEPVSVLVYFSDPLKALKLKLLTRYWHFLDILWIYLVVFFYANYFIQ